MEFLKGVCPHCQGELQIPQDRETIICMYCGKELSVRDAVAQQEMSSRPEPVTDDTAVEALQNLLFGIENPMQYFKKALYMEFFKKYVFENAKNLAILEQAYLASEDQKALMERIAEPLVVRVEEELNKLRKHKRDEQQMDYNLAMVVYVFPALLETNNASGKAWVDVLSAVWKKHFPKTELKSATSKEINAGFRYRFCYITTAVCESRQKPDDCYELSLLRSFRDDYLLKSDEGAKMVDEYYDVAPSIVKHIGKRENADEIYEGIWQQYLSPCIRLIESGQNEECVDLYRHMVYELKDLYFH
ncbi:MAG: hypothetical protein PUK75_04195 [bacterium]|nr:hypothetical protein [bacterium]MDY4101024.1 CFI-box-CTERM domain-containing protein [Lachnospiraceae bacterium]